MTNADRPESTRRQELTVKEYAALERVTDRTVWNWRQKGAVEFRRTPGGRVRIIVRKGRDKDY
jgi:hypothetical protein